jgi:hypothetical protein
MAVLFQQPLVLKTSILPRTQLHLSLLAFLAPVDTRLALAYLLVNNRVPGYSSLSSVLLANKMRFLHLPHHQPPVTTHLVPSVEGLRHQ